MAIHKYYLRRFHSASEATLGLVSRENGTFVCFSLEDQNQDKKVPGETRIPVGSYQIQLRTEGGMAPKYLARFPWHKGMLHLRNVTGFEWVYIHIGNTDKDTDGCILVGDGCNYAESGGTVGNSENAYTRWYQEIVKWLDKGDQVWLRVE